MFRELKKLRDYDVVDLQGEEIDGINTTDLWRTLRPDIRITRAIAATFGFAEEVVGWLTYEDGQHLVGVGESMRPFLQLYLGDDEAEARETWKGFTLGLAWDVVEEEEEEEADAQRT